MDTVGNMNIILISMVKNEVDIIESFIRYHAEFVDQFLIVDNGSSDGTLEILQQLQNEGINLEIIIKDHSEYKQTEVMTQLMYQAVSQYQADIVIPLDADEFLTTDISNDMRQGLEALATYCNYFKMMWQTYLPLELKYKNDKFIFDRFEYRASDRMERLGKIILSRKLIEKKHPVLSMGNHGVDYESGELTPDAIFVSDIKIKHFPIRSVNQMKSKVLVGWINSESKKNKREDESSHWGNLFYLCKEYGDITVKDMVHLVMESYLKVIPIDEFLGSNIVHEPIKAKKQIILKYSKKDDVDYFKNVLENSLQLAHNFAKLKKRYMDMQKDYGDIYQAIFQRILDDGFDETTFSILKGFIVEELKQKIEICNFSKQDKVKLCNLIAIGFCDNEQYDAIIPLLLYALEINRNDESLKLLGMFLWNLGEQQIAINYLSEVIDKDEEVQRLLRG